MNASSVSTKNESSATTSAAMDELPTVDDYRALSPIAVLTLLGGGASALALAHPLLSIVPLGTVVLAIVSLRSIGRTPGQTTGRSLAVIGLCLATLFLGWGISAHFSYQVMVRRQAREFADDWLRILSTGDLERAHQLHVAREYRLDPQAQMNVVYQRNEEAESSFRMFRTNPVIEMFQAAGPGASFHFEGVTLQSRMSLADEVVLKYQLDGKGDGPSIPFWITVRRTFSNLRRGADWEIYAVEHEPPSIN